MRSKLLRVQKDGWWEFEGTILDLEPFRTYGSLKATRLEPDYNFYSYEVGQLPGSYLACLNRANYIIWSYETPIAWWVPGSVDFGWVAPDRRYSVTTSRHQGKIKTCFHTTGYYVDADMKVFVEPW